MTQLIRSLQADLREGGLYEGKADGNWGASPGEGAGSPGWGMRRELLSPRYTTDWSGLWKASCRKAAGGRGGEKCRKICSAIISDPAQLLTCSGA